MQSIAAIKNES